LTLRVERANLLGMSHIENVSDTARWVAVYRAMETARPDAIFRDPFAARLAGEKGEAIVDSMKRGRQMAWAMIVRTAVFDEIIQAQIRAGADQIVNLAAGLDTRPWRMKLPADLRWIDVDLPGILDYKLEMMRGETPVCRYEGIRADLREPAVREEVFGRLGAQSRRTLVVTEGLLIYLTPDQVGALAADLHRPPSFHSWLIDLARPELLVMMQRWWGKSSGNVNAPFQFAPEDNTKFFEPFGWREVEYRSSMDEAQRLRREMPMMWLWRFLGRLRSAAVREKFKRFSGIVLFDRI
jgi:methyltransferase (TIGR00027 family)